MSHRILILAHRTELIEQAADKLGRHLGLRPEIEMADQIAGRSGLFGSPVVVSSIQTQNYGRACKECDGNSRIITGITDDLWPIWVDCTVCLDGLVRRMQRFDPNDFGLVVIDEGHHATAKSYRRVMDYYGRNDACQFLLVTATPHRRDGVGMGEICQTVAFQRDIGWGISEGWLCPIRQGIVTVHGLNFADVRTKAGGDFADGSLQKAMRGGVDESEQANLDEGPIMEVVVPTVKEAAGRQGLVFASGKQHARDITHVLNRWHDAGVSALCVVDDTPKEERAESIRQFKNGDIQFLVGCGVFTEGFDAENVAIIANARPTKSKSLYTQIIGRGTRVLGGEHLGRYATAEERRAFIAGNGKPFCTVLDFVGSSAELGIVTSIDVLAGDAALADIAAARSATHKSDRIVDPEEEIKKAKASREKAAADEEERKRKAEEKRRQAREEMDRRRKELESRRGLQAEAEYDIREVDTFGNSGGVTGQVRRGTISDKQLAYLVKMGMSATTASTWGKQQAGAIITKRRVHFDVLLKEGLRWSQIKSMSMSEGDAAVRRVREKQSGVVQQGHPPRQSDPRPRGEVHDRGHRDHEYQPRHQPEMERQPDW